MTYQIKPIPDGFHTITPHLVVKGASQAIEFYKKAFGAEEICRVPAPDGNSIMHAALQIGDSRLFLVDESAGAGCQGPEVSARSPVTIHLFLQDVDATFNAAIATGAKQQMPPTDMFWGDRYGRLVDPFGHEWSLATHQEDLTPEQIGQRAKAAFCQ